MDSALNDRLSNIENFLERIESKMDNFMGFENLDKEDKEELIQIKEEMSSGKIHSYEEVFN